MNELFDFTQPQKSIWEIERLFQGTSINNIGGTLLLNKRLNIDYWERAINKCIEINDSLRLRIDNTKEKPQQYLFKYEYQKISLIDFTRGTKEEEEDWLKNNINTPFVLNNTNLYEVYILKSWDGKEGCFFKLHHLIADAWTISLLSTQIMEFYQLLIKGIVLENKVMPSYLEYVKRENEYLNSSMFFKDREYWLDKFEKKPNMIYMKKDYKNYYNPKAGRIKFKLETKDSEILRNFCKEMKLSLAVLFEAALMIYISIFLDINDITIGIPIYNRKGKKEKESTGMFVSSVPIRIKLSKNSNFLELCQDIVREHKYTLRHQRYPYNLLLSELRKKHKLAYNLFGVSVSYQNKIILRNNFDFDFNTRWIFNENIVETFCLHIEDRDNKGTLILYFDYLLELFTESEVKEIYKRIMHLLFQGIKDRKTPIREMDLVDEEEKNILLNEYNKVSYAYSQDKCFIHMFKEQVENNPNNIALIYGNKTITYRELNKKANTLANILIKKGVRSNKIVALFVNKSMDMIIAILAIHIAGGAYLPIDSNYPINRVEYMINDSNIDIIITDKRNKIKLSNLQKDIIDLTMIDYSKKGSSIILNNKKDDLAYLIYTSGTTGNPKAVQVDNSNLSNYIFAFLKEFKLNDHDRFLQQSSICFDASVEEIFPILTVGGAIVIVNKETVLNIKKLLNIIIENGVTFISCSPYLLNEINKLDCELSNIIFISGGDVLKEEYISNFKKGQIYNTYGPTEATVCTSFYHVLNKDKQSIPIGKPITNYQVYILNKNNKLLPPGYIGELCISGDGISRGYLNKKELTNRKFISNPFVKGSKMYKTGDLAKWLEDGNIEYCGRIDNQINIRGYRIEIEEIERTVESYGNIIRCVLTVEENKSGFKKLIAYLLAYQDIDIDHLRLYLSGYLPDYMMPVHFIKVNEFPLTSSGKVDKTLLPKPELEKTLEKRYVAPGNYLEKKLSLILSELFEIDKIGVDDNFFNDLGGDSLLVIEMKIIIENCGIDVQIQDIFKYPTIRLLSARIKEKINLNKEDIDNSIPDITTHKAIPFHYRKDIKTLLLTGASGFLGAHILSQIANETEIGVLCLIRSKDSFMKSMDYYFDRNHIQKIMRRTTLIEGDIEKTNLGIDISRYNEIINSVDSVVHAAANSNHFGLWNNYYRTNVIGTKEIIKFCLKSNAVLHHVSTMGVSGEGILRQRYKKPIFSEETVYIGQSYKSNVYIHSKFLAEVEVLSALEDGLNACIYRIGNLMWRESDGVFQNNSSDNGFINGIKSLKKLKVIPADLLNQEVDLTPVDRCAEAFVKLMVNTSRSEIYHLFNYNKLYYNDLFKLLALDFEIVELEDFLNLVSSNMHDKNTAILYLYLNDIKEHVTKVAVDIKYEKTKRILESYDFLWKEISHKYIEKTNIL
ncbi:MAG: amino acid adenylation domain-containing protein [Halanaerobiales bacterium]